MGCCTIGKGFEQARYTKAIRIVYGRYTNRIRNRYSLSFSFSYIPPSPPTEGGARPSRGKRQTVEVDYDAEIAKAFEAFGPNLQTPVKGWIALVANRNKTKTISQSRELSLLDQLNALLETTTPAIFKAAILEATEKKAHAVNYIKAIVKTKSQAPRENAGSSNALGKPRRPVYHESRDGTIIRTDPDGTETRLSKEEFDRLRKTRDEPVAGPVRGVVTSILEHMSARAVTA
ncbi:MAG: hypothetical protein A4E65_02367 [Syntrophorhabdus sp. PtaU1.Bin153]|nr:MAG: hypothetical protein A4E65_02367 [Syntrophorhabdus sp. PtaU1.Bin153]